jgi:hypothetical protein
LDVSALSDPPWVPHETGLEETTWTAAFCSRPVRIALFGSLVTDKPVPKDADVLVTIDATMDLASLARLGRRLKGAAQTINLGADIFLADGPTGTSAASATTESATHLRPAGRATAASGNT